MCPPERAAGSPGCRAELWVPALLAAPAKAEGAAPEEALPLDKQKVLTNKKVYKQFGVVVDAWKRCKTSDTIRFILRSIKNHPVKKQERLLEEEVEEAF